jgi:hypothetical protein
MTKNPSHPELGKPSDTIRETALSEMTTWVATVYDDKPVRRQSELFASHVEGA